MYHARMSFPLLSLDLFHVWPVNLKIRNRHASFSSIHVLMTQKLCKEIFGAYSSAEFATLNGISQVCTDCVITYVVVVEDIHLISLYFSFVLLSQYDTQRVVTVLTCPPIFQCQVRQHQGQVPRHPVGSPVWSNCQY